MGWSISLLDNTVEISDKCAAELFEKCADICDWYDEEDVTYGGYLQFNMDHSEHMDYVRNKAVLQVLKKYKVDGIITFGSLEGDNSGSFWGYQFDDGELTKLTGEVVFTPTK